MKTRLVMSWSGGKDSAVALQQLLRSDEYEVVALMTSVAEEYRRVSHHGVREELLDAQAEAIGIRLEKVYLPSGCSNAVYEQILAGALARLRANGVEAVGYGDLFLEDIRAYREATLARAGLRGVFPIWQRNTAELAEEVIRSGYRAYISCVEGAVGQAFARRLYNHEFLAQLPESVDPCGERGEFHSFVFDGPIFRHAVAVEVGEVVPRDGRFYADLLAPSSARTAQPLAELMPPV
ncbi:MAG: diphthine--ammonia ligase [Chthoniobacterales bacterium]